MFAWFTRKKSLPPPAEEAPAEVIEPVALSRRPSLKEIKAKVHSLDNVAYSPRRGSFKMPRHKVPYRRDVQSEVGSLGNLSHKPGGGQVKIFSERVDFRSTARSRVAEALGRGSQLSLQDDHDHKRDSIVDKLIDSFCSTVHIQNPWLEEDEQPEKTPSATKAEDQGIRQTARSGPQAVTADTAEDGAEEPPTSDGANSPIRRPDTGQQGHNRTEKQSGWSVDRIEQILAPKYAEEEEEEEEEQREQNDDDGVAYRDAADAHGKEMATAEQSETDAVVENEGTRLRVDEQCSNIDNLTAAPSTEVNASSGCQGSLRATTPAESVTHKDRPSSATKSPPGRWKY